MSADLHPPNEHTDPMMERVAPAQTQLAVVEPPPAAPDSPMLHVQHPPVSTAKPQPNQQKPQQKQGKGQGQQQPIHHPKQHNPAQEIVDLNKMRGAFDAMRKQLVDLEEQQAELVDTVTGLVAWIQAQDIERAKREAALAESVEAQTRAVHMVQIEQARTANIFGLTTAGRQELRAAAKSAAHGGRVLPWYLRWQNAGLLLLGLCVAVMSFLLFGGY